MSRIVMTQKLAYAAATDAGNRSMRKAKRTAWNEDDYNSACAEFERLWPEAPSTCKTVNPLPERSGIQAQEN